jgi:hypothetical protein
MKKRKGEEKRRERKEMGKGKIVVASQNENLL